MKKTRNVFLIFLMLGLLLACNSESKEETLDRTLKEIKEADNYTIELFIDSNILFMDFETVIKRDESIVYRVDKYMTTTTEHYIVVEDDVKYNYMKYDFHDTWFRMNFTSEFESILLIGVDIHALEANWYEYREDSYYLKEAYFEDALLDEVKEVVETLKITIDGNSVLFEGFIPDNEEASFRAVFSDLGSTLIDVPDFGDYDVPTEYEPDPEPTLDLPDVEPYLEAELFEGIENTHTFNITTAGEYYVWSESDLKLSGDLRKDGNYIFGASGNGPGHNFLIERFFEVGTYTIEVYDWQGLEQGPYKLYIAPVED